MITGTKRQGSAKRFMIANYSCFRWLLLFIVCSLLFDVLCTKQNTNVIGLWVMGRLPRFEFCESIDRLSSRNNYLIGVRALHEKDADSAIELFLLSKIGRDRNYLSSYQLARLYEWSGQLNLAVMEWREAGVEEQEAARYRQMASDRFAGGEYAEAEELYQAAAALEPESASPFWDMAVRYRTRDNEKMLEVLKAGLERDDSSSWSLVARGLIAEYSPGQDRSVALNYYRNALYKNPTFLYAMLRRSEAARFLDRSDEALIVISQLLILFPDEKSAITQMSLLLELESFR